MTGICVLTSSPRFTRRFSTKPSNGARISVSRSCAARELHGGFRRLNAGAQVLGVLQRRVVARPLRLQRRLRIVERLLRDERPLEELARAIEGLRRLHEVGVRPLHVRRLLDLGQVLRDPARRTARACGRAPPAAARRCTAVSRVELDEHLPGLHPIAEIGQDPADLAVGLGRNRDLIHGGQRADDVNRARNGILANGLDLNRLGLPGSGPGPFPTSSSPWRSGRGPPGRRQGVCDACRIVKVYDRRPWHAAPGSPRDAVTLPRSRGGMQCVPRVLIPRDLRRAVVVDPHCTVPPSALRASRTLNLSQSRVDCGDHPSSAIAGRRGNAMNSMSASS